MTEPLPDTWHNRDLHVLTVVVKRFEEDPDGVVAIRDVSADLDISRDEVRRAFKNLDRGGYVVGASNEVSITDTVFQITAPALHAVGLWPTPETALGRMITALEAIAENTDDEDTRTRVRRILDGLAGAGRTIGLGVATAALTGQIPGQ